LSCAINWEALSLLRLFFKVFFSENKVWDISLESATPLYRAGGGVTLTAWSPDERNLFAASPSSVFRWGVDGNEKMNIHCKVTGTFGIYCNPYNYRLSNQDPVKHCSNETPQALVVTSI